MESINKATGILKLLFSLAVILLVRPIQGDNWQDLTQPIAILASTL